MASEITLTASLSIFKATSMSAARGISVTDALFNMAGTPVEGGTISVATSETTIPMGQVTLPHWSAWHNLDSTNFVIIKNAASGIGFIKLLAGEYAFFPMNTAYTAPVAVADTAACLLEYLICQQ